MAFYVVSYDLNRLGQRYAAVEQYMNARQTAAKLLETVWFIQTPKPITEIREDLRRIADGNDQILVVQISNARGYNIDDEEWAKLTAAMPLP